jgi:cytochrome b561
MSANAEILPFHPARSSNAGRFDAVTIAFHWLTLLLVVGQLTSAAMMIAAGDGDAVAILTIHRSMGVATWLMVIARLIWRAGFATKPPFPASMPPAQRLAAKVNEYGLYALLALQPLTGLGDTVFRGHPFVLFGLEVPKLVAANKAVFHALNAAHLWGAIALIALITLHAAAALLHALVIRDGVFQRMLPWTPRKG